MTFPRSSTRPLSLFWAFATACVVTAAEPDQYAPTAEGLALFEKEVQPLLKANCYKCHGEKDYKAEFSLFTREGTIAGGELGEAVSLEKPEESALLAAINHTGDVEMPPAGKLKPAEIDVLTRWVKLGVPFPPDRIAARKKEKPKGGVVTAESRNYWAYKPVVRPAPPAVKNTAWIKNPIDAFVLAKLEAKGLTPAKPAERIALARRAYYDLTGLPPTPNEIDAFVSDKSPDAYERLLDKLLESPQYGVKWGRHWLDLVRYAETNGYERDGAKPFVWRYRDYVIKSFNEDKPYDQFIREQLAGDEIDRDNAECIIATGYYRLGIWDDEPADPLQARFDGYDDIVATTSQVFLGMTMNCARCHDHKIDPIPQRDYYQMVAFFRDIRPYSDSRDTRSSFNLTDITPPEKRATYEEELKQREAKIAEITAQMVKIEEEAIKKMPAEDQRASEGPDRPRVVNKVPQFLDEAGKKAYQKLRGEREALKRQPAPSQELALSVNNCDVRPPQTHLLIRGSPHSEGAEVSPAFPEVLNVSLPKIPEPDASARTSGRRTVLANWIASKDNQMTSRVMANRLWQHHFGRGIVTSTNDFGKFGTLPTHPELLDYLASELVDGDWRLKRMHKLIMLSAAYQMSSQANDEALKVDPDNSLFWRFNMRRLSAEEVRDSILAVSGKLNLNLGGPSIYAPIPQAVLAGQSVPGQGWGKSSPEEASRRSIFIHVKRSLLVPILSSHDAADSDSSCPVRYTTTVPTQALGMLNGEFTNEQAGFFAQRLAREVPGDVSAQIRRALRLSTGRLPDDQEIAADLAFLQNLQAQGKLTDGQALTQYCLLLLNTNEMLYLD